MTGPTLERSAGFAPLAFGCESLFFGACASNLTAGHADLGRALVALACVAFGAAWFRGGARVQALVGWLLLPTALLVGSLLLPPLR